MALDAKDIFGASSTGNGGSNERPKALLWLNIGYEAEFTNADGVIEKRFVSLPVGVPVDTMAQLKANTSNEQYNQFQQARNSLLEQLIAAGMALPAGESKAIPQLQLQLRKVSDQLAAPAAAGNPFLKVLSF